MGGPTVSIRRRGRGNHRGKGSLSSSWVRHIKFPPAQRAVVVEQTLGSIVASMRVIIAGPLVSVLLSSTSSTSSVLLWVTR
mmetsp:Transcript_11113/g.25934  ORF Transcript_11113/g.25934 Transcript_11113/m.25934 type:complete len:81 (-) Transcript_11113:281-523(-)